MRVRTESGGEPELLKDKEGIQKKHQEESESSPRTNYAGRDEMGEKPEVRGEAMKLVDTKSSRRKKSPYVGVIS